MHIRDIMSRPVITAPTGSTLDAVARLMWEFDCGIVPLVDDEGRLTGVITDRDICMAAYIQGKPLTGILVASAMSSQTIGCQADDEVETVEHLMHDHRIRRVPVLDNQNRPIGIVAMNDLTRLAARTKKTGANRDLVRTLAAVCEPRADVSVTPNHALASV